MRMKIKNAVRAAAREIERIVSVRLRMDMASGSAPTSKRG
jgi:hypothetical protein